MDNEFLSELGSGKPVPSEENIAYNPYTIRIRSLDGRRTVYTLEEKGKKLVDVVVPDRTPRAMAAMIKIVLKRAGITDPELLKILAEGAVKTAAVFPQKIAEPNGFVMQVQT